MLECYLNLLKNRNLLNVYDENIKLTKELISEMKARSEQGVALTNDVTRYELNLSNLTYDRNTLANTVEHLNYSLLVYLGMDEDVIIEPDLDPNNVSMPDLGLNHRKQEVEMSPKLKKFDLAYSQAKTQEETCAQPDAAFDRYHGRQQPGRSYNHLHTCDGQQPELMVVRSETVDEPVIAL